MLIYLVTQMRKTAFKRKNRLRSYPESLALEHAILFTNPDCSIKIYLRFLENLNIARYRVHEYVKKSRCRKAMTMKYLNT